MLMHLYVGPPHHPIPKGPHFDDLAEMFWFLEMCFLAESRLGADVAPLAGSEHRTSERRGSGFMVCFLVPVVECCGVEVRTCRLQWPSVGYH